MFKAIVYPSAKDYWLKNRGPENLQTVTASRMKNADTPNELLSAFADESHLAKELHLMVPDYSSRSLLDKTCAGHVMPKKLPMGAFVEVAPSVFVASPELCYVQAAAKMNLPELVVFANHLCGTFFVDETKKLGLSNRKPLTSVSKIKKFLKAANGLAGVKLARVAINYVLDGSNSPKESQIAALTMIPFFRGGYGLPAPNLNYNIKLSASGEEILERAECCCDMVWPEQRVVVEYDSDLVHLNRRQFSYDKKRVNALQLSGYTVISVTKEDLQSYRKIQLLFANIRKALRLRSMNSTLEKYRLIRQRTIPQVLAAKI